MSTGDDVTQADLEAYLDEALPVEDMATIEEALRAEPALLDELAKIHARRDSGVHTLGEIWRRQRLTCPPRQELGSYLLGVLPPERADYIRFHLETVGCRLCRASVDDLESQQQDQGEEVQQRRRRYFESSAGYLKQEED